MNSYNNNIILNLLFPSNCFQSILNDIILTNVITKDNINSNLFLLISSLPSFPPNSFKLSHYISELYAKLWNETASKNIFSIEFFIFPLDPLGNFSTISSSSISSPSLSHLEKKISKFYTFNTTLSDEFERLCNENTQIISTSNWIERITREFLQNETKTIFLESSEVLVSNISNSSISNISFPLPISISNIESYPTYPHIALGGSFDQLHCGHRKLLTFALTIGTSSLTIGIPKDSMLQNKKELDFLIQPYAERAQGVRSFLSLLQPTQGGEREGKKFEEYVKIFELEEPFGPAAYDPELTAILVSSETLLAAYLINKTRKEKGLGLLDVLVILRNDAHTLSSTYLRQHLTTNSSA